MRFYGGGFIGSFELYSRAGAGEKGLPMKEGIPLFSWRLGYLRHFGSPMDCFLAAS